MARRALIRTAVLAAFVGSVSCKPTTDLRGTVPEDIRFVVVVELDDSGGVIRAGPLTPWSPDAALSIVSGPDRTILLGYDDPSLEAAKMLDAARTNNGRDNFRPVVDCENQLPPASWIAEWTAADTIDEAVDVDTPALTSSWLERLCPTFDAEQFGVDVPCRDGRCTMTVARRIECRVEFQANCDIGPIAVTVSPNHELCITAETCEPRASQPGERTLQCTVPNCAIYVVAEASAVAPMFDVETRTITTTIAKNVVPPQVMVEKLFPFNLQSGYYTNFIVVSDRIVLTGVGGAYARDCPDGDRELDRQMLFLDLETLERLEPVGTSTAPHCLRQPVPDPHGPGFLAIFNATTAGDRNRLGRFAPDGALIASEDFDAQSFGPHVDATVYEIRATSDGRFIVVVQTSRHLTGRPTYSTIAVFDAMTLAPRSRSFTEQPPKFDSLADRGPSELMTIDGESNQWFRFDVENNILTPDFLIPVLNFAPSAIFDTHFHAATGTLIAAGDGSATIRAHIDGMTFPWQASVAGPDVRIMAMVDWPLDDDLVFATGGMVKDPWRGVGVLISLREERILPGRIELARSSGTLVRPDGRGRLLVLHPWSGELSRITPR